MRSCCTCMVSPISMALYQEAAKTYLRLFLLPSIFDEGDLLCEPDEDQQRACFECVYWWRSCALGVERLLSSKRTRRQQGFYIAIPAGFTIENNPSDALMIICPPPDTQRAAFAAKMRLLQSQGLSPQLFLTAADLQAAQKKQWALHQPDIDRPPDPCLML